MEIGDWVIVLEGSDYILGEVIKTEKNIVSVKCDFTGEVYTVDSSTVRKLPVVESGS